MRVNQGKVIAIRGSIVDVLFPDSLPEPHSLLKAGINKPVALGNDLSEFEIGQNDRAYTNPRIS